MTRRSLFVVAAVCAAVFALAVLGIVVRRSRTPVRAAIPPDTVIGPLVNGAFNNRVITRDGERYFYKIFLPRDYTRARKWPVIFALHGGRTRGYENVVQAREGLANVVRAQADSFPAIVIFPQVPTRARGHDFIPVDLAMIDRELTALRGDRDRVYLTGSSFGGFTAFQMAYLYPERFAALVPVAAGIDLSVIRGGRRSGNDSVYVTVAKRLRNMPVWIFHGERDEELGVDDARRIARVFRDNGVAVRYTEFKDAPHSVFTRAWQVPELLPWLLQQRRGARPPAAGLTPR